MFPRPFQQWAVGKGTFCGAPIFEDYAQHFQLPSEQVLLYCSWTKSLFLSRKVPKAGRGVMKVEILFKLLVDIFNVLYLPSLLHMFLSCKALYCFLRV